MRRPKLGAKITIRPPSDPLDVAIYCAFMWSRGWSTVEKVSEDTHDR